MSKAANSDQVLKQIEEHLLLIGMGEKLNTELLASLRDQLPSEQKEISEKISGFIFLGADWDEDSRLDLMTAINECIPTMRCRQCGQPEESGHCDDCYKGKI